MTSTQLALVSSHTWVVPVLVVLVGSFLLGGATSFAQGVLPRASQPLVNSASGWTILTALLVWAARQKLRLSFVLGAGSFVALVLGYTLVSSLRSVYFNPLFWSAVGVLAGPFVGAAASTLHQRGRWAAAGVGVLAGIMLGDCSYGLTAISATTGRTYWILVGVLGLALLIAVSLRQLRTAQLVVLALAVALTVALAMNAGYAALNAGSF